MAAKKPYRCESCGTVQLSAAKRPECTNRPTCTSRRLTAISMKQYQALVKTADPASSVAPHLPRVELDVLDKLERDDALREAEVLRAQRARAREAASLRAVEAQDPGTHESRLSIVELETDGLTTRLKLIEDFMAQMPDAMKAQSETILNVALTPVPCGPCHKEGRGHQPAYRAFKCQRGHLVFIAKGNL